MERLGTANALRANRARRRRRLGDGAFHGVSLGIGLGLIVLLGLILAVLLTDGYRVLSRFGIHFLIGRNWNPVIGRESFGALPFIFGTLVTSAIAIVLAVPVAVGVALLLNEIPSGWIRNPLAVVIDLLAAIPSVVYGLWGVFVLLPFLDHHVEPFLTSTIGKVPVLGALFRGNPNGGDLFSAGIILAIMILPIITAVAREVVTLVPRDLREAALALGATRYEVIRTAVLPYSRGGIVGATMLGLGRALGETIAVAMVVGNGLGIGASLFKSGYTIPAVIANEFREATNVGLHRSALLALAFVLVLIALLLAAVSRLLVGRTEALAGGRPEQSALGSVTAPQT
ncbi:MAG TPA: phosphate ABC transporter permease subunit PstC [Actinomycetota bacterium]